MLHYLILLTIWIGGGAWIIRTYNIESMWAQFLVCGLTGVLGEIVSVVVVLGIVGITTLFRNNGPKAL